MDMSRDHFNTGTSWRAVCTFNQGRLSSLQMGLTCVYCRYILTVILLCGGTLWCWPYLGCCIYL